MHTECWKYTNKPEETNSRRLTIFRDHKSVFFWSQTKPVKMISQHCTTHPYYMASSESGQDESNPALWLATRVGKMELSCSLGTTRRVPQEKFPRKPYNKSFIDQACLVKMAGYWPSSFFACLWTETANIQPSWPHAIFASIARTFTTLRDFLLAKLDSEINARDLYFLLHNFGVQIILFNSLRKFKKI